MIDCGEWITARPGDLAYELFCWCPECGGSHGYLNIGHEHWYHCHIHRTKWRAGSNLFSSWRYEDETIWQRNADHLADFREVDSQPPTPALLERLLRENGGMWWSIE
jgi:hypothetical protein